MHLGFIGLGHLGKAIAGRLLERGHSLTIWNRTAGKAEGLKAEEARSPRGVAEKADIVFVCLFDSAAVGSVFEMEGGLLSTDLSGKVIVDLSTNHYRETPAFHEVIRKAGGTYLEAPVLGSVVPAAQGALTVLVSGETTGYEKARPALEDIGKQIFYLAEPARATKMKLINNLCLGGFMAAIAEAVSFGEDVGIARKDVLDILAAGAGQSLVLNAKKTKLLEGDFSTHFSSALMYKDLHCLEDLAYERKRSLPAAATVKELFARTFEEGIENEDFSAVYKLYKRR